MDSGLVDGRPASWFSESLADRLCVELPAGCDAAARERFISELRGALREQAELASACDAVLRPSGAPLVEGRRVFIPHEPASAALSAHTSDSPKPDLDELYWIADGVCAALAAAEAARVVHGGIQIGAIYCDEAGRIKLGDFGVGLALQVALGADARGMAHREDAHTLDGQACSGLWSVPELGAEREHGWQAPYCAHELLENSARANAKSDQFSAGVALFLLAGGRHPYGAALNDPQLMCYFHLEPFDLGDDRPDWREAFERAAKDVSNSEDRPLLALRDILSRLLASDPGQRFGSAQEAKQVCDGFVPSAWREVIAATGRAARALQAGDAHAYNEAAARLRDIPSLPPLWRQRAAAWTLRSDAEIGRRVKLAKIEQGLTEGRRALDLMDLERARRLAQEACDCADATEELRAAGADLLAQCDELDRFVHSGADALAQTYLDTAREFAARRDYDGARPVLEGLMGDPATPRVRLAQARELLEGIEQAVRRERRIAEELAGVRDDVAAGRLDAANARLGPLAKDDEAPPEARDEIARLRAEVDRRLAARAEHAAALETARGAWERGELAGMRAGLAQVEGRSPEPAVADTLIQLQQRASALEAGLAKLGAAQEALSAADLERAAVSALEGAENELLPDSLRKSFSGLAQQAQDAIELRRREARERAAETLARARAQADRLELDGCWKTLAELASDALDSGLRSTSQEIESDCNRAAKLIETLAAADALIRAGRIEPALASLDRHDWQAAHHSLGEQCRALRERAQEALAGRERERLAQAERSLERCEQRLAAGALLDADGALREVEGAGELAPPLRKRAADARIEIEKQQSWVRALEAAEQALAEQAADRVDDTLGTLPPILPGWAADRASQARASCAALRAAQRRERIERAQAALSSAEAALDALAPEQALAGLAEAAELFEGAPELATKRDELVRRADALAEGLRVVADLESRVEGDAAAALAARRAARELIKADQAPAALRPRVDAVIAAVEAREANRRTEIDAELTRLSEAPPAQHGSRRFVAAAERLAGDACATAEQQARAAKLRDLPPSPVLKASRTPYVVGAVGLVAVLALALGVPRLLRQPSAPSRSSAAPPPAEVDAARETTPGLANRAPEVDAADSATPAEASARKDAATSESPIAEAPPSEPAPVELADSGRDQAQPPVAPSAPPEDEIARAPQRDETVVAPVDQDASTAPPDDEVTQAPEPPAPDPRTIENEFARALAALLAPEGIDAELQSPQDDAYEVEAQWNGRPLLAFGGLTLDLTQGRFSAAPENVADYFSAQVGAIRALAGAARVALDATYDDRVRFDDPQAQATVLAVADDGVTLRAPAFLEGDDSGRSFTFTGRIEADTLRADEEASSAFHAYVSQLQADRLAALAPRCRDQLLSWGLPADIVVESAAGEPATLRAMAGPHLLAQTPASWRPQQLMYEVAEPQLRAAIRDAVGDLAASQSARLADAWPDAREAIAIGENEPGGGYFRSAPFGRLDAQPAAEEDALNLAPVTVTLAETDALAVVRFAAQLELGEGGALEWDRASLAAAAPAIRARLAEIAADERFRERQEAAALDRLAATAHATRASIQVRERGAKLAADAAGRPYSALWDARRLDYEPWAAAPPPPPPPPPTPPTGIDEQLARLAQGAPAPDAFVNALAGVAEAKIAVYAPAPRDAYGVSAALRDGSTDAADRLARLSESFQRLVVEDATRDAYPTVFVEHYLGKAQAYALSWRAVVDGGDRVVGVEGLSVRAVGQGSQFASMDGAAVRAALAQDGGLGEGLLGAAIGPAIAGKGSPQRGAFGVLLAPDGPLWLARWEQARFGTRPVRDLGRGAPAETQRLRELLAGAGGRSGPRVGVWCAPTLAGAWRGSPEGATLTFCRVGSGRSAVEGAFKHVGGVFLAPVVDPTEAGDFGWPAYEGSITKTTLGQTFWNRGWRGERWRPTAYTSFALLPGQ